MAMKVPVFVLVVLFSLLPPALCEGEQATEKKDARLAHLFSSARDLRVSLRDKSGDSTQCELFSHALLRYQNPLFEAQSDGALLLWTIEKRPVAFASYSIRKDKNIFTEFASVADAPLEYRQNTAAIWMPSKGGFEHKDLPKAPKPSNNKRLRLLHMKRLAERFHSQDNRLLPTPLYRYSAETLGVTDGAVFALVTANDPEVLIIIEAYQFKNEPPKYRYNLGRMSSTPRTVYLDDEQIWKLDGYWNNPRSAQDSYVERLDSALPESLRQDMLKTDPELEPAKK